MDWAIEYTVGLVGLMAVGALGGGIVWLGLRGADLLAGLPELAIAASLAEVVAGGAVGAGIVYTIMRGITFVRERWAHDG